MCSCIAGTHYNTLDHLYTNAVMGTLYIVPAAMMYIDVGNTVYAACNAYQMSIVRFNEINIFNLACKSACTFHNIIIDFIRIVFGGDIDNTVKLVYIGRSGDRMRKHLEEPWELL